MITSVNVTNVSRVASFEPSTRKGDVKNAIWETYAELADNAYRKGFYDIATKMLQAVIKDLNSRFPESNDLPVLLSELGKYYHQQKEMKKAEVLLKRALESYQREKRSYDPSICSVLELLGEIYCHYGRYQFAERLFKRQFSVTARLYGKKDTRLIKPLQSLIDLYRTYGKTERASALYDRMTSIELSMKA
ncbi:MAG TPA: tetratricopeptide repeat protein [Oculatellaceae cyanobacterium]